MTRNRRISKIGYREGGTALLKELFLFDLRYTILGLCLLISGFAQASTYTAASCSYADVNAVINGPTHTAVNGDVIGIPAGTCTWTTGIAISGIGITIDGQGTPNTGPFTVGAGTSTTVLIDNAAAPLFRVTGITYGQTMRVSLINLQPVVGAGANTIPSALTFVGTYTASGCPNIRVDNVTFPSSWDGPLSGGLIIANDVFGVVDHTSSASSNPASVGPPLVQIAYAAWAGTGANGDNSFASADTYGSAQVLYLENNYLNGSRGTENDVGDSGLGGNRAVCRYNTFNPQAGSGMCSSHGTSWLGRPRGQRQVEIYRNTVSCTLCDGGTGISSGTGLIFENHWTGYWNKFVSLDVPRDWHSIPPWNYCDGAQPYDTNDGVTYAAGAITTGGNGQTLSDTSQSWTTNQWAGSAVTNGNPYSIHDVTQDVGSDILSNTATQYTVNNSNGYITWNVSDTYQILRAGLCVDQPGRSGGTLYSGTTPSPSSAASQTLDPIYEWGDVQSGGSAATVQSASVRLLPNRDYYGESNNQTAQTSRTSPFNGTSGNGHGTLANRPTTCTTGVAYWATDQGNWNQSGIGGQGELYVCTAANTWSLYYTPYVYPHPLVSGATPPPPPPPGNPPPPPVTPPPPPTTTTSSSFSPLIYPNPWRSDRGYTPQITFSQLTGNTTIKIFTVSSHLVKTLTTSADSTTWDLTNNSGHNVASGIYIYLITDSQGDKAKGKVAVIR